MRRGWRCGQGWRSFLPCCRSTYWAMACATRSTPGSAEASAFGLIADALRAKVGSGGWHALVLLAHREHACHDNLDTRPQLLSVAPHGHEGGAGNIGLRGGLRSRAQSARWA